MYQVLFIAILVIFGLVIFCLFEKNKGRKLGKYWLRDCTGKDWKNCFPESTSEEIRDFLELVVDAFLINRSKKLKFEPSDKIMDIYRTIYPSKWRPDSMELETLVRCIEKKYGLDLTSSWNQEITLGQIFELITKR